MQLISDHIQGLLIVCIVLALLSVCVLYAHRHLPKLRNRGKADRRKIPRSERDRRTQDTI